MVKVRRFLSTILLVVFITVTLAACSNAGGTKNPGDATSNTAQSSQQAVQLSIGTATMGGAYYPVGQEISNLIMKYVPGSTVTPEVTGGSSENPRLVDAGDVELGLTNSNLAYFAVNGQKPYTEKLNISAIGNLHPSVLHIVTLKDSRINSIADLKGKKIAAGPAGGGTLDILAAIMSEAGLSINDIKPSFLAYSDGFTQLADGNVDAALALSGYPASAVTEVSTTKEIKIINIEEDLVKKVTEKYPYYSKVVIPKETYKLDQDGVAIGVNNVLIVKSDMDENLVYQITKAIYDHLPEFGEANANAKQINADTASQTPIALHPGAQKYFDELGKK